MLALTRSLLALALLALTLLASLPALGAAPAAVAQEAPQPEYLGTDDAGVPRYRLPPGASPARTAGPHRADYFVTVGGRERVFRLVVPADLDGRPAPLVLGLHALYSDRRKAEATMDWQRLSQGRFVVVYPQALDASWNAGRCCGRSRDGAVDDVAALSEVVRLAGQAYPLDPRRRYVSGLSNGGMMALTLACTRPDLVAAVLAVAAAHMSPCRPARAVPLMQVHGTADSVVPYAGTPYSDFLDARVPSVADTQRLWRGVNAPASRATALARLEGVDHGWPRASFDTTGRGWAFLRDQVSPCRPDRGPRAGRDGSFHCG